jgi:hypothetical protein
VSETGVAVSTGTLTNGSTPSAARKDRRFIVVARVGFIG